MGDLLKKRILFFGGKGGVGKTTCASAVALGAAKAGKRVLLVSTDPAHSTSDIFERPFGREEAEVYPGLAGLEIDAEFEARHYIETVKGQIAQLFSPSILKEAERQIELVSTMPGVEDIALFNRMGDLIVRRSGVYDLIVFDTAPTGHTMRLLQLPELMTSWIDTLARRRKNLVDLSAGINRDPAASDPILAALEQRKERLVEFRARLMQHNFTGFVLVLVPERLPIEESARAARLLIDAHVRLCGIIVNRVLPDDADGAFYQARRRQEETYRDEIRRRFAEYPIVWIPQFETDVYGLSNLEHISRMLSRPDDGAPLR